MLQINILYKGMVLFIFVQKRKEMNKNEIQSVFEMNEKIQYHLSLTNKRFYNGIIIKLGEKCLIIDDRKLGIVNIPYSMIGVMEPTR